MAYIDKIRQNMRQFSTISFVFGVNVQSKHIPLLTLPLATTLAGAGRDNWLSWGNINQGGS